MGFLDNMVSGLIRESTGYDTRQIRRLVRRIGGSRLLMAGGAAVAGALAAQHLNKSGKSGEASSVASRWTGTGAATPPPPPSGGPVPPDLPPLPPLPTSGSTAEGEATADPPRELLFAVVRTMAAAALADGEMAPEERAVLEGNLDDSGLDPEQIQRVRKDLVLPPTPGELAEMVEDLPEVQAAEARETLFRAAALIVHADREVGETEATWLGKLAGELGLSPEQANTLRAQVFAEEDNGAVKS